MPVTTRRQAALMLQREELKIVHILVKEPVEREQGWLSKLSPPTIRKLTPLALPDYGPNDLRRPEIQEMVFGDLFYRDFSNWPQDFWIRARFDTNRIYDFLYRAKLNFLFPYQARYANPSEKIDVTLGCYVGTFHNDEMKFEEVVMGNLDLSKASSSVWDLEIKIGNAYYDHFAPKGYACILIKSIAFKFVDSDVTVWV